MAEKTVKIQGVFKKLEERASAFEGIPGEVIAAISAAVACMEGGAYRVSSVAPRRAVLGGAGDLRSAWSAAGLVENTRPFVHG
ncbi:MAG: hypothetical protein Q4B42_06010 [Oscillospiraceae bacterium]|nr:hypothetical protein [Oscillospiraceae bacterium]